MLIEPKGTLIGISAYKARCNFIDYLLQDRTFWECVNDVSFNLGVINIVTWGAILIVIPLILKNYIGICKTPQTASIRHFLFLKHQ